MAANRQTLLKFVTVAIAVLFTLQIAGGFFKDLIPYEIFNRFHGTGAYFLTAGIAAHVFLNWQWFKSAFGKKKQTGPEKNKT